MFWLDAADRDDGRENSVQKVLKVSQAWDVREQADDVDSDVIHHPVLALVIKTSLNDVSIKVFLNQS